MIKGSVCNEQQRYIFLDTYKLKYIEINDQIKYNKKLKGLTF